MHDALLVGGSLPDRAEPAAGAGAEPVVDPLSVPQCPRVVAPPGLPDAVSVGIDVESRTADGGHPRVAGGIVMVDVAYADRFVASVAGGEEERLSLGCALLEELLIGADRIDGVTRQEVPPGVVDHCLSCTTRARASSRSSSKQIPAAQYTTLASGAMS